MKIILSLTLIACFSVSSFAQSRLSFKIYQNTDIFKTRHTNMPSAYVSNFDRISFAFDIMTKKGNTHEVEFLIPEFSKPIEKFQFPMQYVVWEANNIESAATSYSIRYEIQKILPNNSERINFRYGVGINPYYVKIEYTPSIPNAYYTSFKYYGFAWNVTPGLNYKLNRFFSIDLNAPVRIYNFQRENNRQDNPILPLRQQRRNYLNHLFFEPAYTIRLGLRYTPNK